MPGRRPYHSPARPQAVSHIITVCWTSHTRARARPRNRARERARTHAHGLCLSRIHSVNHTHAHMRTHARIHFHVSLSHTDTPHLLTHSHAQAPMDARTDLGTHARTFHSATIMLIHPGARAGSAGPDRGPFRAGPQAALPLPACGPGAGAPDDSDCARRCRRRRRRCLAGPPHGPQRIVVVPAGPTVPGRAR
jgi:hypothetical protein